MESKPARRVPGVDTPDVNASRKYFISHHLDLIVISVGIRPGLAGWE